MYKSTYQNFVSGLITKSIQFTFRDSRKVTALIIVTLLPFIGKIWVLAPPEIEFPHYGLLQTFLYSFSVNFISVLVAVAWFLSIPRKDFALQIIALSAIFYGLFMTYDTLPFTGYTPLWLDVSAILFVFICVCIYLFYIHRNYLSRITDYKVLHDGIVNDLHHQRFLGEISRLEGLLEIAEMEEHYRVMCKKEISKLKESVSYIAEKYDDLK